MIVLRNLNSFDITKQLVYKKEAKVSNISSTSISTFNIPIKFRIPEDDDVQYLYLQTPRLKYSKIYYGNGFIDFEIETIEKNEDFISSLMSIDNENINYLSKLLNTDIENSNAYRMSLKLNGKRKKPKLQTIILRGRLSDKVLVYDKNGNEVDKSCVKEEVDCVSILKLDGIYYQKSDNEDDKYMSAYCIWEIVQIKIYEPKRKVEKVELEKYYIVDDDIDENDDVKIE